MREKLFMHFFALLIIRLFIITFVLSYIATMLQPYFALSNFYNVALRHVWGNAWQNDTLNLIQIALDLAVGQFILLVVIVYSICYPFSLSEKTWTPTFIHLKFLGGLL